MTWKLKPNKSIKIIHQLGDITLLKIDYNNIKLNSKLYYALSQVHDQLNASLNSPALTTTILVKSSSYMILRDNHIIASAITSPWNVAYSLHSQASHSNLIINIHSPVKVKFAIHRIHVINKHRRQRLGLLLLNSIAQNQVYGYTLSPNQIAFSQPTTAGSCLASSWFNINSNTSKALSYLVC